MKRRRIRVVIVIASLLAISGVIGCSNVREIKVSENKKDSIDIEANFNDENNMEKNNVAEINTKIQELENIINAQYMVLVNRENKISSEYEPEDLVLAKVEFLSYIETRELNKDTAKAVEKMFFAAEKEGIKLLGASGYRSYNVQKNMYDSRVLSMGQERTSQYTAEPGASEHQTGLAIDILGEDYQYLDDGFEESESFKWLIDNCYKYGFILRYLKGKEDITGYNYEPWHFRYIGNEVIAKEIMDNNITLEEYLENIKIEIAGIKETIK